MQNIKSNSGKPRLTWIDIAKGIATLLVVYRHVLYGIGRNGTSIGTWLWDLNEIVYSFRMPLFFILSGIFFAKSAEKRTRKGFLLYKGETLMYPYLVWALIQVTLQVVLSKYTNANRDAEDYLFILIKPRAIDQLWFLYTLFNVTVLYYFLKYVVKIPPAIMLVISIAGLYLSTLVIHISLLSDMLFFTFFFFFGDHLSGKLLSNDVQDKLSSKTTLWLMLPVFALSQWYFVNHLEDINIYLFSAIALFGSIFTIAISILISPQKWAGALEYVGRNSLQIYVMHVIISSAFRMVATKVLGIDNVYMLLAIGLASAVFVPLYIVRMSKRFPQINWLFNPPK